MVMSIGLKLFANCVSCNENQGVLFLKLMALIQTPPFYVFERIVGMHSTIGGLKINTAAKPLPLNLRGNIPVISTYVTEFAANEILRLFSLSFLHGNIAQIAVFFRADNIDQSDLCTGLFGRRPGF
jgi:hypothetical protein